MDISRLVFLGFNILMAAALLGIIVHVYRPSNRKKLEAPKYTMLDGDE